MDEVKEEAKTEDKTGTSENKLNFSFAEGAIQDDDELKGAVCNDDYYHTASST